MEKRRISGVDMGYFEWAQTFALEKVELCLSPLFDNAFREAFDWIPLWLQQHRSSSFLWEANTKGNHKEPPKTLATIDCFQWLADENAVAGLVLCWYGDDSDYSEMGVPARRSPPECSAQGSRRARQRMRRNSSHAGRPTAAPVHAGDDQCKGSPNSLQSSLLRMFFVAEIDKWLRVELKGDARRERASYSVRDTTKRIDFEYHSLSVAATLQAPLLHCAVVELLFVPRSWRSRSLASTAITPSLCSFINTSLRRDLYNSPFSAALKRESARQTP